MYEPFTQPPWLAPAWAELGQHEIAGNSANPRIRDLFTDAGHPEIASDEVAWCAAFVSACLERADQRSTRSLLARSYLDWGDALAAPAPGQLPFRAGAVVVLSRDPDPAAGHVGFLVGETADNFMLLGGNQSNGVTVAPFAKSRVLAVRWPHLPSSVPLSDDRRGEGRPKGEARQQDVSDALPASSPRGTFVLFSAALAHVLEMEGGYTDDPADPGGPTNCGVTLADYARFRPTAVEAGTRANLIEALKHIPPAEVHTIYQTSYWQPAGCESLPAPLAFFHFDTAVNMGVGTSIRMLQTALGVTIDGELGGETAAAAAQALPSDCLESYASLRRRRYRALAAFPRYGRGWLARVDTTLARSKSLIPLLATKGTTMTTDQQTAADPKWWGQSMTIWGAVITGLAAVLPALSPAIGVDVTPTTVHAVADQIGSVIQAATGLAGTLMAIYGRVRATQPLQQRLVTLKV